MCRDLAYLTYWSRLFRTYLIADGPCVFGWDRQLCEALDDGYKLGRSVAIFALYVLISYNVTGLARENHDLISSSGRPAGAWAALLRYSMHALQG